MSNTTNQLFVGSTNPASTPNTQLYATDGTAAGTKAITSGGLPTGIAPADFVDSGPLTYFTAVDSAGSRQVYSTDGTTVTRLDPTPNRLSDGYIDSFFLTPFTTAAGGAALAFIANGGTANAPNFQLYVTTGTAGAGTKAITTGGTQFGALPSNLVVSGNTVYFTATSGTATEVYATDGTSLTRLDPKPNSLSASYTDPFFLTPFTTAAGASALAFIADAGTAGAPNLQLYVTTGTAGAGTVAITTGGTAFGAIPGRPVVSGNTVYFTATDGANKTEVYATDGSSVTRLDPKPDSLSPSYTSASDLTPFTTAVGASALAFIADAGTAGAPNFQLYVTTGTAGAGTVAITTGGTAFGALPGPPVVSGNTVYFTATSGTATEVYATDGKNITRLDPTPNSLSPSYIDAFFLTPFTTAAGASALAFIANAGTSAAPNFQLYVTTGTAGAGTKAITTGGTMFGAIPGVPVVSGNTVYFTATTGANGATHTQVYATDGASIVRVDPSPNSLSPSYDSPLNLTAFTTGAGLSALAFVADVGKAGAPDFELLVTTGTAGAGTKVLTTSTGIVFGSSPQNLVVNGGSVYFTATDGSGGQETYVTDGNTVTRLDPQPNALSDSYSHAFIPAVTTYTLTALSAAVKDATSGTTPYTFTVTRTGDTTAAATLGYTVAGSGATPAAASLFANPTGTVSFAQGQSLATLTLNVNGASVPADAGFTVTLRSGTGSNPATAASIAVPAATGTILHNVAPASYAIAVADASKPDGLTGLTPYTFTVTRAGDASGAATLTYAVTGSGTTPAPASLFANPTGTVAFAANATTATVTVNVNAASIVAPEAFAVTLSGPAGTSITTPSATGTIAANVAPASFAIAATDASKADGLTGVTPYTFTVTRAGDTSAAATLTYAVAGSGTTPAPASLFANPTGTVAFAANATTATVTVNVNGASVLTPEAFAVTLSGPTGTNITGASATGTITPNVAPTSFAIAAADASKPDGLTGLTPYTFTVTRSGDASAASTLSYAAKGTGAVPVTDNLFTNPTGSVAFATGETTKTVTLNLNPASVGTARTFAVTLSGPADANITGPVAAGTLLPNSTITNAMPSAQTFADYADYYVSQAANVTGAGTALVSTILDAAGDVAVVSAIDGGKGHVISATGSGQSVIEAGSGNDTVTLNNGSDLLATGLGSNTIYLQGGINQVRSQGNDTINIGGGIDQIEIGGTAFITPSNAMLVVKLDAGASLTMHTGIGTVTVEGGYGGGSFSGGTNGGNRLVAGTSATTLYAGGDGDELLASGGTGTTLYGWGGHEILSGQFSQGANVYNPGGANVLMVDGSGTNTFNIGTGHADIVAKYGTDLFNFTSGNANTTYISDMNIATAKIHLVGFAAGEAAHALATASNYMGNEVVSLSDGTKITFGNVTGLTTNNFV